MEMDPKKNVANIINETCTIVDAAIEAGEPPHVVLDVTKSGLMAKTAKTFTRSMGLPSLSSSYGDPFNREWNTLSDAEKKKFVRILLPSDIMADVIRDIVERTNLSSAAIFYDTNFDLSQKHFSLLKNLFTRHTIRKIGDNQHDIRMQLQRFKNSEIKGYFVLGTSSVFQDVFRIIGELEMFNTQNHFYAISKEENEYSLCPPCHNATLMTLKPHMDQKKLGRLNFIQSTYNMSQKPTLDATFYFDLAVRGIKAAGLMEKAEKYQNFTFVKCDDFNENSESDNGDFDFRKTIESVLIEDLWFPLKWGQNGEAYPVITLNINQEKILNGSVDSKTYFGEWQTGLPGKMELKSGFELTGIVPSKAYRIVTVIKPPFMYRRTKRDGAVWYEGFLMDLLAEIQNINSFDYEIYETPDKKYGFMDNQQNWDGIMKELLTGKADMSLAALSLMEEREAYVDFTIPFYEPVGFTLMTNNYEEPTNHFKILVSFESNVWLCIFAAYLVTSMFIWLLDSFSPLSFQNDKKRYVKEDDTRIFDMKEGFWFCLTSMCAQGGGDAPKNFSGKIVAATWWLFGFIITASYSANLSAFLTASRLNLDAGNLEDLPRGDKYSGYSVIRGSETMVYFERQKNIEERLRNVWIDMVINKSLSQYEASRLAVWEYPITNMYVIIWFALNYFGMANNTEEMVERIRSRNITADKKYIFIGDASDQKYLMLKNCDLTTFGPEHAKKPYALAVPQGSPLKELLNDALLKLQNERRLETLKEKWWNQNPEKANCDRFKNHGGISMGDMGALFFIIFVGIIAAFISLFVEYWYYSYYKPMKNKIKAQYPQPSERQNQLKYQNQLDSKPRWYEFLKR